MPIWSPSQTILIVHEIHIVKQFRNRLLDLEASSAAGVGVAAGGYSTAGVVAA